MTSSQTREYESQLLIRITREQRDAFQAEAKRRNSTASEMIREFISSTLPENDESPGLQTGAFSNQSQASKRGDAIQ